MTQEEKAKAYDGVREKIAIRFGSNVADEIFPELKESEDEKIRKALLEMVHDTTEHELWIGYGVHKEDALAWLEKQGEHKSIEYPLCKTVKDKIDYYIVNHFTTDTVVKTDVNSIVKAMKEGDKLLVIKKD